MINAEVAKAANNMILVRFSEPNEEFRNTNWIPVQSVEEVKRRVYFKNRIYILNTLTGWLKQRQFSANTLHYQSLKNLLDWLSGYQNASLYTLCAFLKANRDKFEKVAPGAKSTFHNHYLKTIIPIFEFAELEEDNQR
ncbi:MAG: hypothetical protein EOP55_09395 [Sphingobacteriales bacterium]|nr:MAG: hypothetical protein EOP55_09395 [Sphingobacteriales bacterium]